MKAMTLRKPFVVLILLVSLLSIKIVHAQDFTENLKSGALTDSIGNILKNSIFKWYTTTGGELNTQYQTERQIVDLILFFILFFSLIVVGVSKTFKDAPQGAKNGIALSLGAILAISLVASGVSLGYLFPFAKNILFFVLVLVTYMVLTKISGAEKGGSKLFSLLLAFLIVWLAFNLLPMIQGKGMTLFGGKFDMGNVQTAEEQIKKSESLMEKCIRTQFNERIYAFSLGNIKLGGAGGGRTTSGTSETIVGQAILDITGHSVDDQLNKEEKEIFSKIDNLAEDTEFKNFVETYLQEQGIIRGKYTLDKLKQAYVNLNPQQKTVFLSVAQSLSNMEVEDAKNFIKSQIKSAESQQTTTRQTQVKTPSSTEDIFVRLGIEEAETFLTPEQARDEHIQKGEELLREYKRLLNIGNIEFRPGYKDCIDVLFSAAKAEVDRNNYDLAYKYFLVVFSEGINRNHPRGRDAENWLIKGMWAHMSARYLKLMEAHLMIGDLYRDVIEKELKNTGANARENWIKVKELGNILLDGVARQRSILEVNKKSEESIKKAEEEERSESDISGAIREAQQGIVTISRIREARLSALGTAIGELVAELMKGLIKAAITVPEEIINSYPALAKAKSDLKRGMAPEQEYNLDYVEIQAKELIKKAKSKERLNEQESVPSEEDELFGAFGL